MTNIVQFKKKRQKEQRFKISLKLQKSPITHTFHKPLVYCHTRLNVLEHSNFIDFVEHIPNYHRSTEYDK